jgi:hypothetical protein
MSRLRVFVLIVRIEPFTRGEVLDTDVVYAHPFLAIN